MQILFILSSDFIHFEPESGFYLCNLGQSPDFIHAEFRFVSGLESRFYSFKVPEPGYINLVQV